MTPQDIFLSQDILPCRSAILATLPGIAPAVRHIFFLAHAAARVLHGQQPDADRPSTPWMTPRVYPSMRILDNLKKETSIET
jgi:hypothetical protein